MAEDTRRQIMDRDLPADEIRQVMLWSGSEFQGDLPKVWAERFTGGSDSIAVRLGKEAVSVRLFDPAIGVSAVETLPNVDSISLSLTNHPVVIEVSGPAG